MGASGTKNSLNWSPPPHNLLRRKAISCSSTTHGDIRAKGDLKVDIANLMNVWNIQLEKKQLLDIVLRRDAFNWRSPSQDSSAMKHLIKWIRGHFAGISWNTSSTDAEPGQGVIIVRPYQLIPNVSDINNSRSISVLAAALR